MKRLALVLGPLALGALAYFLWRAPDLRLHAWVPLDLRAHAPPVPSAITGSLPDACWAFSFGAALALVWSRRPHGSAWMIAGLLVTMGLELGQLVRVIPGVFDPIDLAAMTIAYLSSWRICRAGTASPPRPAAAPASPR